MKKIFFILMLIAISSSFAQNKDVAKLSGSLYLDFQEAYNNTSGKQKSDNTQNFTDIKKSTYLAGILSALVPGAGEFYAKSYLKTALFLVAEATAITAGVIYNKKGNNRTTIFENFADKHWSVARYALWTLTNLQKLNGSLNPNDYSNLFYDKGETKVDWAVLNKMEGDIGGYYSHQLYHFGEQQYYEMIGKYPQFNPGWDDFGNVHTPYTYGDPLTKRFLYYSGLRGRANHFYYIAEAAVIAVIVNHFLSALDAVWTVNRYNERIETKINLKKNNYGFKNEFYPQLSLTFRF